MTKIQPTLTRSEQPPSIPIASAANGKSRYSTLDGMRGIAALAVAVDHFGIKQGHRWAPEAYLAVDIFFLLSGFVIALSYTSRLATRMSWRNFMITRLIRLYPLYLLGALIGIFLIAAGTFRHRAGSLAIGYLWPDTIFSLLLLPAPAALTPDTPALLFPLNGPSWSLFFELLINLVFAIGLFRFRSKWLIGLCSLSAIYLVLRIGSPLWFNGGWGWSTVDLGIARVLFSFPLGILLWRHLPAKRGKENWLALAVLAGLAGTLIITVPVELRSIFELVEVAVIFPLLLIAGKSFEVPHAIKPLSLFWAMYLTRFMPSTHR